MRTESTEFIFEGFHLPKNESKTKSSGPLGGTFRHVLSRKKGVDASVVIVNLVNGECDTAWP
jgi:hypothetical protein